MDSNNIIKILVLFILSTIAFVLGVVEIKGGN